MKSAILAATIASACAFAPAPTGRSATAVSETKADLEALAKKLNPVVSFISLQSYVEVVHMICIIYAGQKVDLGIDVFAMDMIWYLLDVSVLYLIISHV